LASATCRRSLDFRGLSVEDNIRAVLEITSKIKQARTELEALLEDSTSGPAQIAGLALSARAARCEIARALRAALFHPLTSPSPASTRSRSRYPDSRSSSEKGAHRVLITDHNVRETLGLIDRAYIIHAGRVLTEGAPVDIIAMPTCAVSISATIRALSRLSRASPAERVASKNFR